MDRTQFNWVSGQVVYWDLDGLEPTRPLHEQHDCLKEDLAQVQYGSRLLLDVGWYPESSLNGAFVVRVVDSSNWDVALFETRHGDVDSLRRGIAQAILFAEPRSRGE